MNLKKHLLLFVMVFIVGKAHASLILDQSFDSSNIIVGANFSQGVSSIFDDFSLSEAANIQEVSMWGGYWTTGVQPSSFDFRIQIRSSLSVDDVIFDSLITAFNVTDTGFNHNGSAAADILKFDFNLAGLMLDAGNYFIGISSQNAPAGTSFYWQRDDDTSLNGGITGFDNNINMAFWGNQSLAIRGTDATVAAISEPSTFAVMLLGIYGFIMRKRTLSTK